MGKGDIMICPILSSHFQPPVKNARPALIFADCIKGQCGFWNNAYHRCAVEVLPEKVGDVANRLCLLKEGRKGRYGRRSSDG